MNIKRLPPKNDFVFQRLFGRQENKEILISFLNAVLDKPGKERIKDITIINNTKLEKDRIEDKTGILDIKAETDDGTKINIEIQLLNQYNMEKRTLFYWAKMYGEPLKAGQNYQQLRKTITINLLDFEYLAINRYHSVYHLWEDHEKDFMLSDMLEIRFIELPKFRKERTDTENPLHRWLMFLEPNIKQDVLEVLKMNDQAIAKAEEMLEWLSCDDETRSLYEAREKALYDYNTRMEGAKEEGWKEGIKEGVRKEKIEMAKSLIQKNMDVSFITEVTKLTEEEIKQLKQQLEANSN